VLQILPNIPWTTVHHIEAIKSFHEPVEKLEQLLESVRDAECEVLTQAMQAFVAESWYLKAVSWVQFTPYFNNFKELTFNVHTPSFYFNRDSNVQSDLDQGEGYFLKDIYLGATPGCGGNLDKITQLCETFANLLYTNKHLMQRTFGDPVKVTILKDKCITAAHDHV
jgi:hypothetical protein